MATLFDIAFSYASEDKDYVEQVSKELVRRKPDIKIYDYSLGKLNDDWGENLERLLCTIYGNMASYTLAFISVSYKKKFATNIELRIAHQKAALSTQPYLLPLKLDDTEMEEVDAFVFLESKSHELFAIVDKILNKLSRPLETNRPSIELRKINFSYKGWHKKQFKIDGILISVVVNQVRVKAFSELKTDIPFREKAFWEYNDYQGVLEINEKEWIVRVDIDMWWGVIKRIRLERENIIYEYWS